MTTPGTVGRARGFSFVAIERRTKMKEIGPFPKLEIKETIEANGSPKAHLKALEDMASHCSKEEAEVLAIQLAKFHPSVLLFALSDRIELLDAVVKEVRNNVKGI